VPALACALALAASAPALAAPASGARPARQPAVVPSVGPPPPVSGAMALMPLWEDGKAEVSTYRTFVPGDSGSAPFETRILVGRRALERRAAAGAPPAVLEMRLVESGGPRAGRALRALLTADSMRVVTLAAAHSAGGDSARVHARGVGGSLDYRERSAGRPERRRALPWGADATYYDALPVWLRGVDMTTVTTYRIRMLPPQLAGWPEDSALVAATVDVRGREGAPSATSRGTCRVDLRYGSREDRFYFHPAPPHLLLRWERADGSILAFAGTRRSSDWGEIEAVDLGEWEAGGAR
jgi:hypothetical protein